MADKCCKKCGVTKDTAHFYKRHGTADGLRSHCKQCYMASNKKWALANPDTYKDANRSSSSTWRARNPLRSKEVGRKAARKFAVEHTAEYLWRNAKYRAKRLRLLYATSGAREAHDDRTRDG